jgi:hypothetical protein
MEDTNNLDYLENVSNASVADTILARFQAGFRCTQVGRNFVFTGADEQVRWMTL